VSYLFKFGCLKESEFRFGQRRRFGGVTEVGRLQSDGIGGRPKRFGGKSKEMDAVPSKSEVDPAGEVMEAKDGGSARIPSAGDLKSAVSAAGKAVNAQVKGAGPSGSAAQPLREYFEELQDWEVPYNSIYAIVALTMVYLMCSGPEGYSPVTLLSLVILARLLVVYMLRTMIDSVKDSEKLHTLKGFLEKACSFVESNVQIPTSSQISMIVQGSADILEEKANRFCSALRDATEPTEEGFKKLKIMLVHLVGVVLVFKFFAVITVVYFYAMYKLIWPKFYASNKERVDKTFDAVNEKAEPLIAKGKTIAEDLSSKASAAASAKFEAIKERVKVKKEEKKEK